MLFRSVKRQIDLRQSASCFPKSCLGLRPGRTAPVVSFGPVISVLIRMRSLPAKEGRQYFMAHPASPLWGMSIARVSARRPSRREHHLLRNPNGSTPAPGVVFRALAENLGGAEFSGGIVASRAPRGLYQIPKRNSGCAEGRLLSPALIRLPKLFTSAGSDPSQSLRPGW